RQLARYSELAAKLSPSSAPGATEDKPAPAPSALSAPAPSAPSARPALSARSPAPAATEGKPAPAEAPALSFDAPALAPAAMAHDGVSRRFVLGDRSSSRLYIIDEVSHHVVSYASAATAGFYDELTGFAIDGRRGDLWVASCKGKDQDASSLVHKLQLVS